MITILTAICIISGQKTAVSVVQTDNVQYIKGRSGMMDAWLVKDKKGETHRVRSDNCQITKARVE